MEVRGIGDEQWRWVYAGSRDEGGSVASARGGRRRWAQRESSLASEATLRRRLTDEEVDVLVMARAIADVAYALATRRSSVSSGGSWSNKGGGCEETSGVVEIGSCDAIGWTSRAQVATAESGRRKGVWSLALRRELAWKRGLACKEVLGVADGRG